MVEESATSTGASGDDSAALKAEIERLKAENEELKSEPKSSRSGSGWRWTGFVVLLVIGAILLQTAVAAVWLNRTVMDTDRWVETVAPLADEPAIQDAVAFHVTAAVFEEVDVVGIAEQALPEELQFLAAPIGAQVEEWVRGLAETIVRSDQFSDLWREANRIGHQAFIAVATGEGGDVVTVEAGVIGIDTEPIVALIREQLEETAIGKVSNVIPWEELNTQFVIYDSPALGQVQELLGWLNRLAWFFPLLSFAFLGAALWLAPDRRRGWMWLGIAVAIASILPLQGVYLGRMPFAEAVYSASGLETEVGIAFYDIVLRFLVNALRSVAMLGVVIALAGWLAGPSKLAVMLRGGVGRAVSGAGSSMDFGEFGLWVAEHKAGLRIGGVGAGVLALVLWSTPTPGVIAGLAVAVAIWLLLVEFFGREPAEGESAEDDEADDAGD
jgi:hypothetical protein